MASRKRSKTSVSGAAVNVLATNLTVAGDEVEQTSMLAVPNQFQTTACRTRTTRSSSNLAPISEPIEMAEEKPVVVKKKHHTKAEMVVARAEAEKKKEEKVRLKHMIISLTDILG